MTTETATAADAGQTTTTPATAADAATDTPPASLLGGAEPATAGDQSSTGEGSGESQGDEPAGDGGKKPDEQPAGAPEKYEIALPDGLQLDEAVFTKAEPVLRELNLTNEQATKLASVIAEVRASESEAFVQQVQEWGNATAADPEIGGKALGENLAAGRRALATHGTPELRALLDNTGLGNHPEVVRFFTRIGKTIPVEDKVVNGERSGSSTKSFAERIYGKP